MKELEQGWEKGIDKIAERASMTKVKYIAMTAQRAQTVLRRPSWE